MNLIDVTKSFATEDQCLDFLEHVLGPVHELAKMRVLISH